MCMSDISWVLGCLIDYRTCWCYDLGCALLGCRVTYASIRSQQSNMHFFFWVVGAEKDMRELMGTGISTNYMKNKEE